MAWELNTPNTTEVVAKNNGQENKFDFSGTMKLKDAIGQVASKMGYGSVLVTADGRAVEPDEGDTLISSFSRIEVMPKHSAA